MRRAFLCDVRFKPSEALRFLGALAAAVVLLGLLVLRVTGCAPQNPPGTSRPPLIATHPRPQAPPPAASARADCLSPRGWDRAAQINGETLNSLPWAPFHRPEIGWRTYLTMIQTEIGTTCEPNTPGFAAAYAAWQGDMRILPTGVFAAADFAEMKGRLQERRPFVMISAKGICPGTPDEIAQARSEEGYAGKAIVLRPGTLAAYRRMVAAAKAEEPAIAEDPRNLTIFSGYRSPSADAARCAAEGNCDGVVRATCSAHRTGLAVDLYVGQAPGFGPDSSADPNRQYMTQTPAYRWMVRNAKRFGFVNYAFEPWHWEWTGEQP